jgi:hypothetical protein
MAAAIKLLNPKLTLEGKASPKMGLPEPAAVISAGYSVSVAKRITPELRSV